MGKRKTLMSLFPAGLRKGKNKIPLLIYISIYPSLVFPSQDRYIISLIFIIYIYVHTHLVTEKRKKIESVTIIKKIISGLKMIWFPPG